jgi:hypothetical protein
MSAQVAHRAGEALHHGGVADVLALRGRRHQQVLFDQPSQQLDVVLLQPMRGAELAHVDRAQHRVVATAALGDVVEEPGHQQQPRRLQAVVHALCLREAWITPLHEAGHDAKHFQRVLVDRVHVEQVVLHAPRNARKGRQVAAQHAEVRHARQRVDRLRALQQREEHRARVGILLLAGRNARQRLGHGPRGF